MPTVADYTAIQDASLTLPKRNSDRDETLTFDAPNVSIGRRPILAFRANPNGAVTLKMWLNKTDDDDDPVVDVEFADGPARSWHEIIASGLLTATGNTLKIARTAGPGKVIVSDIVMHFQADV